MNKEIERESESDYLRRQVSNYIYKCDFCKELFPHWAVNDAEWKNTGLGRSIICKDCFEKIVKSPKYLDVDDEWQYQCYMRNVIYKSRGLDTMLLRILARVYNMTKSDCIGLPYCKYHT